MYTVLLFIAVLSETYVFNWFEPYRFTASTASLHYHNNTDSHFSRHESFYVRQVSTGLKHSRCEPPHKREPILPHYLFAIHTAVKKIRKDTRPFGRSLFGRMFIVDTLFHCLLTKQKTARRSGLQNPELKTLALNFRQTIIFGEIISKIFFFGNTQAVASAIELDLSLCFMYCTHENILARFGEVLRKLSIYTFSWQTDGGRTDRQSDRQKRHAEPEILLLR